VSNVVPGTDEFTGYDYVGDSEPSGVEEGQTWYDSANNSAFVYDGAAWIELSVSAHGELSNVGASDHHTRYSDSEAVNATDGVIDADTVDGQHASDLGSDASVVTNSYTSNLPSVGNAGQSDTRQVFGYLEYLDWNVSSFGNYGVQGSITVKGMFGDVFTSSYSVGDESKGDSVNFDSVPVTEVTISQSSDDRGSTSLNQMDITLVEP